MPIGIAKQCRELERVADYKSAIQQNTILRYAFGYRARLALDERSATVGALPKTDHG
jgi:hypothetical protein